MIKFKFKLPTKNPLSVSSTARGFTIVELIISIAILAIITPAVTILLTFITNGLTSYEASTQLRLVNQRTLNRIYTRLGSSKRIFQNNTSDLAFLNTIDLAGSGYPAAISGSTLPTIQPTSTLIPGTSSFIASNVGNCLFFANNENTWLLSSGSVRIDTYCFNYYYLAANPKPIPGAQSYSMVEFRSYDFADYNQLQSISGVQAQRDIASELYSYGVVYAWDPTSTTASSAFYNIASNGNVTAAGTIPIHGRGHAYGRYLHNKVKTGGLPAYVAPSASDIYQTNILTGILFGGYKYGVSCNSAQWSKAPKTVPMYATASNSFPGGFEVAIAGPSAGREVLMRCVLVAKGSMRIIPGDDTQVMCSARDLW